MTVIRDGNIILCCDVINCWARKNTLFIYKVLDSDISSTTPVYDFTMYYGNMLKCLCSATLWADEPTATDIVIYQLGNSCKKSQPRELVVCGTN